MINKIINILPIVQSLRQSEIQGKDKKQINAYICKYLCNVEMGNSNTGATEEEVEEIENEEKVEILPVRKIVGNITLPDSIENANKIWLKILKYMNLKTLLRLLQSCLIKQLCKSYKNKAFQRSVEMAITHRYHLNVFHIQLYPNIIVQYTIVRSFYQLHHHR